MTDEEAARAALRAVADMVRGVDALAERTAALVKALPPEYQHRLRVASLRCPGNQLILEAFLIPDSLNPALPYLLVPASAIYGEQPAPWWLTGTDDDYTVRCRCHPRKVRVTVSMLTGESSPPAGYKVG